MLRWALVFLIVAIVAGIFGFAGSDDGGSGSGETSLLCFSGSIRGFSGHECC
jgi:uncharacterized membrane protein YtjA (UPF0391 family)